MIDEKTEQSTQKIISEDDTAKRVEDSIRKRFRKKLFSRFTKAIVEYDLIQPDDKIAVCISGGKDSFLLAKCMQEILRHGKMAFGLKFLVMDPGYHPANRALIEENAALMGDSHPYFPVRYF